MPTLRDLPIKQKLVLIIMVTTAAALVLAGVGIIFTDSVLFRDFLQRDLSALARIIADNSTGSLAFNDPDSATQTLGALRAKPHVAGACTYRIDQTLLASYSREGTFGCPPPGQEDAVRVAGEGLVVSRKVFLRGRQIGTVVLVYDLGEAAERIQLYGAAVLAVLLISSLLALLLASRLRSVITTPISELVQATTTVSDTGDYAVRAQKISGDELGVLVDRFNEMLTGIQTRDNDLKKAILDRESALREVDRERQRFHFLAESMPQKIFTAASNGEIDYFNQQWMPFTGLAFDEIKHWGWTQFVHPDDVEENVRLWKHSVATGEPFHFEHRFRRADGKYRWHLSRAHAFRDANGNIAMWIGSNTEIQEQKEKEEALRRANDDLQQFVYFASHDLQEPIRNVAVYSEIVAKRYQSVLDNDGLQYLGFLKEGGRRLANLVNDLLAYTRAGVSEDNQAAVDSSAVLQQSLASLSEAIREKDAKVTYDALPNVQIGEAHLQQLFLNLIGNALKYRDQAPPRIHVSATNRGTTWCFSVQDNGLGIDPKYKEKIFGLFKRLHHDRSYSGTGIGLAICQRVVQRYGGRIWVESEPGKGATFFFTVPRQTQPLQSPAAESAAGGG